MKLCILNYNYNLNCGLIYQISSKDRLFFIKNRYTIVNINRKEFSSIAKVNDILQPLFSWTFMSSLDNLKLQKGTNFGFILTFLQLFYWYLYLYLDSSVPRNLYVLVLSTYLWLIISNVWQSESIIHTSRGILIIDLHQMIKSVFEKCFSGSY